MVESFSTRVEIMNRITGYVLYPTFVGLLAPAALGLLPWWPVLTLFPVLAVGVVILILSTRRPA